MDKLTPLDQLPVEGLVKQQVITYRIVDGKMRKTVYERVYMAGDDYQDSQTTEVLVAPQ